MDELQTAYRQLGENNIHVEEEAVLLEKEVNNSIEKAERVVKDIWRKSMWIQTQRICSKCLHQNRLSSYSVHLPGDSHMHHSGSCNQRLNPLEVLVFSDSKFLSLVDQNEEPPNIKMARLRQSLSGAALEAIRGLGVTEPEYNEAKEILQAKFGGE